MRTPFEAECTPTEQFDKDTAFFEAVKSIAVSLKRIADKLEGPAERIARIRGDRDQSGFTPDNMLEGQKVDNS
jgi:hypothetical protein